VREYETTFIVQPEISDEGSAAILAKLDGILESAEAVRLICHDLGKRKLAYEINKFHKGHYYMLSFANDGQVVPELERSLRLDESILRFLTIQAEEEIADIEARKVECKELEDQQEKRAAERAAREAEEERDRREAEARATAEAAVAAEAAAVAAAAAPADAEGEAAPEAAPEAAAEAAPEAAAEAAKEPAVEAAAEVEESAAAPEPTVEDEPEEGKDK